jgi:hypothetical protein
MSDKFRARFTRFNRAVQTGLAALFAVMGVLLCLAFLLLAPDLLAAERPLDALMNGAAAVGLCWLQWRYRHIVYPQLRRDYLAEKRA